MILISQHKLIKQKKLILVGLVSFLKLAIKIKVISLKFTRNGMSIYLISMQKSNLRHLNKKFGTEFLQQFVKNFGNLIFLTKWWSLKSYLNCYFKKEKFCWDLNLILLEKKSQYRVLNVMSTELVV